MSQKSNLPDYISISGNLDTRSYKADDVIPLSFAGLTVLSRGITVTNNKIQLVPGKHYRITCCSPYIDNSSAGRSLRIVGQGIDFFYFDPYSPTATYPSYPSSAESVFKASAINSGQVWLSVGYVANSATLRSISLTIQELV